MAYLAKICAYLIRGNYMINNNIILVNEFDQPIGEMEKLQAHKSGLLHRAFSVFILTKTDAGYAVLLQKRSADKYHSAGLWSNSCCSHPKVGEATHTAAQRRCMEEIGLTSDLQHCGHFIYRAELENGLTEHELDHVFYAITGKVTPTPNPDEVAELRWVQINELEQDLNSNPAQYSIWLKPALALLPNEILHPQTAEIGS